MNAVSLPKNTSPNNLLQCCKYGADFRTPQNHHGVADGMQEVPLRKVSSCPLLLTGEEVWPVSAGKPVRTGPSIRHGHARHGQPLSLARAKLEYFPLH
jgi:hypothetical protein